jgi:hypothetical protein
VIDEKGRPVISASVMTWETWETRHGAHVPIEARLPFRMRGDRIVAIDHVTEHEWQPGPFLPHDSYSMILVCPCGQTLRVVP